MQNIKIMLKSPRFLTGLIMLLIVVAYAVFYPMINTADPKANRLENPEYKLVLPILNALGEGKAEEAVTLIDGVMPQAGETLQGVLQASKLEIERTGLSRALSGAKQVKGTKYPLNAEFATLKEVLELPKDASAEQMAAAESAGNAELDRLQAHYEAVLAAAEAIKAGGAVTDIADPEVRAEFEPLMAQEDLAAAVDKLVAGHEANQQWVVTVRERLGGVGLEYDDARKVISSAVPGTFLVAKNQPPSRDYPLGTDMESRDVLLEMAHGARLSLMVGLIAGCIATVIGLIIGLFAGYVGGWIDNTLSTGTNLFLVIPSFVILILISVALGQIREAWITGLVIGLTAWPWTAKSVRAQTVSLRYRDHVNMARITGYSTPRIIVSEILPYIASYVVMAFILQVSSGILSEAQLSLLGLGPKTTEVPTLGLMMNWAMKFKAHTDGYWWAYFPIILVIAGISFSLNLMNTGLDQVFNPALRD